MSNKAGLVVQVTRLAPEALKAHALLNDLCARYDVGPFIFTTRVRIDPGGVARPRPVLTLGTDSIDDPPRFLAEFLGQQILWFLAGRPVETGRAATALKARFPEFYQQNPELESNEAALYHRVAAAWLEMRALGRFFSTDEVEDILRSHNEARPVYRMMLRNRSAIGEIVEESGLAL